MTYLERYDAFVFDLDGTLADTLEDLARSVNHALSAFGRPALSVDVVRRSVGNGARTLIERSLASSASLPAAPDLVEAALKEFLLAYDGDCTRSTRLYPGVAEALESLERVRPLAVLTNKPMRHTMKILEGLGIAGRFRRIVAGDSLPSKKPDPAGLIALSAALPARAERVCLVGDSAVDVQTARSAGAAAAVVTYGFQPEPALAARPDHVLQSLADLLKKN